MPGLPSSGTISASQINTELARILMPGKAIDSALSINDVDPRWLADKVGSGTQISFADFYDKHYFQIESDTLSTDEGTVPVPTGGATVLSGTGIYTVPAGMTGLIVVLVAGGGAGGGNAPGGWDGGGGGGAGGVDIAALSVSGGQQFNYSVGAGGSAVNKFKGGNGTNTTFGVRTAIGGGGGGGADDNNGANGGSGGGGRSYYGIGTAGLGTVGQGYNGGTGAGDNGYNGGGGGAGGWGYSTRSDLGIGTGTESGGPGTQIILGVIAGVPGWGSVGDTGYIAGGGGAGGGFISNSNLRRYAKAGHGGGDGGLGGSGAIDRTGNNGTAAKGGGGGGAGGGYPGYDAIGGNGGSGTIFVLPYKVSISLI